MSFNKLVTLSESYTGQWIDLKVVKTDPLINDTFIFDSLIAGLNRSINGQDQRSLVSSIHSTNKNQGALSIKVNVPQMSDLERYEVMANEVLKNIMGIQAVISQKNRTANSENNHQESANKELRKDASGNFSPLQGYIGPNLI